MRPKPRWRRKLWNFEMTKIDRCPPDEWSGWLCTIAIQPALSEIGVSVSNATILSHCVSAENLNKQDFFQCLELVYPSTTDSEYLLQIFYCCSRRLYEGTAGSRCALRRPTRCCKACTSACISIATTHSDSQHFHWNWKRILHTVHCAPCITILYLHLQMLQLTLPFTLHSLDLLSDCQYFSCIHVGTSTAHSALAFKYLNICDAHSTFALGLSSLSLKENCNSNWPHICKVHMHLYSSPKIFSWIVDTFTSLIGGGALAYLKQPKCWYLHLQSVFVFDFGHS